MVLYKIDGVGASGLFVAIGKAASFLGAGFFP
jgi:hypothetical protein